MKENGLSLVSLVITIIILLILASVSIAILYNNNIINKAQIATNKYLESETNESSITNNFSEIIDNVAPEIGVGDYVEYTPTENKLSSETINMLKNYSGSWSENYIEDFNLKTENLLWRVLDISDGKIRLISDSPTYASIELNGYQGYNNGVYLVNQVCKDLYSSNQGQAKNLAIEDIESHLSYDYRNFTLNNHKYGDIFKIDDSLNQYYPQIYFYELGSTLPEASLGLSVQNSIVNQTDLLNANYNFTISAWNKELEPNDFSDYSNGTSKYFDIFFNNNNSTLGFLISSRFVDELDELIYKRAEFGLYWVKNKSTISNYCLYNSKNQSQTLTLNFRPVVTLNNDVKIEKCHGKNSKENMHKIIN